MRPSAREVLDSELVRPFVHDDMNVAVKVPHLVRFAGVADVFFA